MNPDKWKNQRGTDFTIVLNDDWDGLILKNVKNVFSRFMNGGLPLVYFACIYHDKDMIDSKTMKTPHYHVVLQLSRSCRIGTIVNTILELFNGLNENQISIDKCSSLSSQSRYLIHLDDYDKYQYESIDVLTNQPETFNHYLDEIPKVCDVANIIQVCEHYHYDIKKIMVALGYDNYKKWRMFIMDLRKDRGLF